jgi:hypothetical protein
MKHPPHPEERRRRVSKDGRPRLGLLVRDEPQRGPACAGWVNCAATLLTMRGQPVRPGLLRPRRRGAANKAARSVVVPVTAWSPKLQAACWRAVCVEKPDRAIGGVAKVLVAFMTFSPGPSRCSVIFRKEPGDV